MNRHIFETWVESQLAPTLQPGDVVILDNLSSHKSEKAKAILKSAARGSCSSRPQPRLTTRSTLRQAQEAFAKLKAHLRRIGARSIDALRRAVGSICHLYAPD